MQVLVGLGSGGMVTVRPERSLPRFARCIPVRPAITGTLYPITFAPASLTDTGQSGMQAVTVISTRRSGEFNITSTVVLAGLLVGKNLAYSSL